MEKSDIAVESFKKGFNCAQAVFSTYSEEFGIDEKTAKRISTAFGGGIVMQQQTCGAVSGAFMLIGEGVSSLINGYTGFLLSRIL